MGVEVEEMGIKNILSLRGRLNRKSVIEIKCSFNVYHLNRGVGEH